jgi:hypothetical protein
MLPVERHGQDRNTRVKLDPETQRRVGNPLLRILDYFGYTIDDVVNRPDVKHKVAGAYKVRCALQQQLDFNRSGRALRFGLHR